MSDANDSSESASDESRTGDFFALVCYVPNPLKSAIETLRAGLTKRQPPPAHITILPPRPLACDIDDACQSVAERTQGFASFEVELGDIRCFRETNFLYVDIEAGSARLRELHEHLADGALQHDEAYEYRPHLTLAGPIEENRLTECERSAADAWLELTLERRVEVQELVCLQLRAKAEEWVRVGSFFLQAPSTSQTADHKSKMLS